MILVTNDSGLDQGSGSKGGKKQWDSRWNLKVEPLRFAKGLEIGYKKERSDCKLLSLQTVKVKLQLPEIEKSVGGAGLQG